MKLMILKILLRQNIEDSTVLEERNDTISGPTHDRMKSDMGTKLSMFEDALPGKNNTDKSAGRSEEDHILPESIGSVQN